MIRFNQPIYTGKELEYIQQAIEHRKISGDGHFTALCHAWLERQFHIKKVLLTTSCTHALEMTALLADIQPGDEVIAPAFTFVSTVNPFVLRGARIKCVDIRPDTMNIDENLIEAAITPRTRAIIVVHYAGVACNMDVIMAIAQKYHLLVIEDAAQGVMACYKGQALGSIGDMGAFSFHETKNYSMGEGGALLLNQAHYIERAEIIREKGTDRSRFFRGEIDKYSWCDVGSSYLPSDLNAAYLWAQLQMAQTIHQTRLQAWQQYYEGFTELAARGDIQLPNVPKDCQHNGHLFYIKCSHIAVRTQLIQTLKQQNIAALFHYIPLHTSKAGMKYVEFVGEDKYTTRESEKLLRLPLYYCIQPSDISQVIEVINRFYDVHR